MGVLVGLLVAGGIVAAGWLLPGKRIWVDSQGNPIDAAQTVVRHVTWSKPAPIGKPFNTSAHEYEPGPSATGHMLYFIRGMPGQNADIYHSLRQTDGWTEPQPVESVNTDHDELGPRPLANDQYLAFYSNRPGGIGGYDIYLAPRKGERFGRAHHLPEPINSRYDDYSPTLSADGRQMIFASNRPTLNGDGTEAQGENTPGDYNLYIADVASDPDNSGQWVVGQVRLMPAINTAANEGPCALDTTANLLYFASDRPGGLGGFDLYCAQLDATGAITQLTNLGPSINTAAHETDPQLTRNGFELFFSSNRKPSAGGYDIYHSDCIEVFPRRPIRSIGDVNWSWWGLGVAAGLGVGLILLIGPEGYGRLNILQRCVLVSLIVHILLTAGLSLLVVSQQIIQVVAPDAGMVASVNLDVAREVEAKLQTRQTITDLPVADPSMRQAHQATDVLTQRQPLDAEQMNLPIARTRPSRITVEPTAPPVDLARATERVALPAPRPSRPTIQPKLPKHQLVEVAERRPDPRAADIPPQPQPLDPPSPARQRPQPIALATSPTAAEIAPMTDWPSPTKLNLAADVSAEPIRPREVLAPQPVSVSLPADSAQPQKLPDQPAEASTEPVIDQAPALARREPAREPDRIQRTADLPLPTTRITPEAMRLAATTLLTDQPSEPVVALHLPTAIHEPRIDMPSLPSEPVDHADARISGVDIAQPLLREPIGRPTARSQPAAMFKPLPPAPARPTAATLAPRAAPTLSPARMTESTIEPVEPRLLKAPVIDQLDTQRLTAPPSLYQRSFQQKQRLIQQMGGTEASEESVENALRYLQRMQEPEGRWTQVYKEPEPTGGRSDMDSALTSLALLCFLASNHTPDAAGPYRDTVEKAIDWLLQQQRSNGDLRGEGDMYAQAMATLALAEAATMTNHRPYAEAARQGAQFVLRAQHQRTGGWRYEPGDEGDTSVFGWQIMALDAAQREQFDWPDESIEGAWNWLARVTRGGRQGILSGYQNDQPTPTMTAEALFSRMLLGENIDTERRREVGRYLNAHPANKGRADYYRWYYTSLSLIQLGGEAWDQWNATLRDHLIDTQQGDGPLRGSWPANSQWALRGGRIYSTALATLTLQVYYRYLPMYRNH